MHTISTSPDGDGYRAYCSCGWTSSIYGTSDIARSVGYGHKEYAENSIDQQPGGSDDPQVGW